MKARKTFIFHKLRYIISIFFLLFLAITFYLKSQGIPNAEHYKITHANTELINFNHSLKESIVETRYHLQQNFDLITKNSNQLSSIQKNYFKGVSENITQALTPSFIDFSSVLSKYQEEVEQFKSTMAVYNNSRILARNLASKTSIKLKHSSGDIQAVINRFNETFIVILSSETNHLLIPKAKAMLKRQVQLSHIIPEGLKEEYEEILKHTNKLLKSRTTLSNIISSITNETLSTKINALTESYYSLQREKSKQAEMYQKGWVIITFLLALMITYVMYHMTIVTNRLKKTVRSLDFQQFALNQHAIVSISDAQGNITYVNDKFCEISEYTREELIGKNHRIVKSGAQDDAFFKRLWRTISQGKTWHGEIKNNKKGGGFYWVNSSIVPLLGKDGKPYEYISIRTDITEQKLNEDKARELQSFFTSITEALAEGVYAQDGDGLCTYANPTAEKLLGWSASEMIGKSIHQLVHYQDHNCNHIPSEECSIYNALMNREAYSTDNEVFWRKDGSMMPVHVSAVSTYDSDNVYRGGVIAFQDISKRKQQDKALKDAVENAELANKAKGLFLANMSHEIRTPMNAIIGMSYLALQTGLNEQQKNYIHKVNSSAEALLRLLNDILDFSKIEANKLDIEVQDFSLDEVLMAVTDLISFSADQKGLELIVNIDKDIPNILMGDALRLRQIIVNFASNAIKFTQKGSVIINIVLLGKAYGAAVLGFTISDTGIGMTEAQKKNLFKAFTQADISTTRKYGGTGLGLAITGQLVSLMGGSVDVKTKLDKGSSFSFCLNFKVKEEFQNKDISLPINNTSIKNTETNTLNGAHILLVEDNKFNQEVASSLLKIHGMSSDIAENGEQALLCIEKNTYDCVLMDCQMPIMDGYSATEKIRERWGDDLPIIAMTANVMAADIERTNQVGMNDYIAKPINVSVMIKTMAKWIVSSSEPKSEAESVDCLEKESVETKYINIDLGISLLGDINLCYKLLARFKDDFSLSIIELSKYLNEKNTKSAVRLSHTLRGASANIGSTLIPKLAAKIELYCNENKIEKAQNLIPEISDVFTATLNEIDQLLDLHNKETTKECNKNQSTEEAKGLTILLEDNLKNYDANSEATFTNLLNSMTTDEEKNSLGKIGSAIKNYDFEQALIELKNLNLTNENKNES